MGTRRKFQYVTEIKTLVDSAHRTSVIFGDKAVEAENCSTCPTSSSCHGAGRGEGRADVSTKQKVFPRRQSVGVMTVMPQHAEKEAGTYPFRFVVAGVWRGSSGLVQLKIRREGNVSSIKTRLAVIPLAACRT